MTFDEINAWSLELKPGQSIRACTPFMGNEPRKIHIRYVLDSIYEREKLYVYAIYGKKRQYWHEFMCSEFDMKLYISRAKEYKK